MVPLFIDSKKKTSDRHYLECGLRWEQAAAERDQTGLVHDLPQKERSGSQEEHTDDGVFQESVALPSVLLQTEYLLELVVRIHLLEHKVLSETIDNRTRLHRSDRSKTVLKRG